MEKKMEKSSFWHCAMESVIFFFFIIQLFFNREFDFCFDIFQRNVAGQVKTDISKFHYNIDYKLAQNGSYYNCKNKKVKLYFKIPYCFW